MTGKELIDYIVENHLEEAVVTVTATMYYNGDHDCQTTEEISISKGSKYLGKEKLTPTINLYVDDELY